MNDHFYIQPSLDHRHHPGDLLRMRPTFVPDLPDAAGAWQILYVSTTSRGDLIPASGIVITPDTDTGTPVGAGAPAILVYHPSFRGLSARAPSQLLATGYDPDTATIAAALAAGWVVAVADGDGHGVSGRGPHTFLSARTGARIVLDLARAAHRIPDLDSPPMPVAAWGYADGGRAVAAAGELAPQYAPEVNLRGICAGAVASDLAALAPVISRGPYAALGLAGLVGLSRAYPHLPLRHVLTLDGKRAAAAAEYLTVSALLDQFPQPLSHWTARPDPWNDLLWRYVFAEETLARAAPTVPIHLYHGRDDNTVPLRMGQRTLLAYRLLHADVSWSEYDADHARTAVASVNEILTRLCGYLVGLTHAGRTTNLTHARL
ncbi:lipase family protein [Nocardia sp. alder85J]|uniref:lipase family protein n=1 Tax=Nocardia sp. alder85J TaxID=2862949 RepID=UPI001CD4694E|nr:lipase family protein [Nocardia sp. alder85J]MCX4098325.1 hypothetical protein [Nocardia sp. alder85J]